MAAKRKTNYSKKSFKTVKKPIRKPKSSTRAIDVSLPHSLVMKPSAEKIAKFFSRVNSEKRHKRRAQIRKRLAGASKKALQAGIYATAKIAENWEVIGGVGLAAAGVVGALAPESVVAAKVAAAGIEAVETLINRTTKQYNAKRSPTLQKHHDRAADIMNRATHTIQFEHEGINNTNLFESPFSSMNMDESLMSLKRTPLRHPTRGRPMKKARVE
jgi:hypothetical protein